MKEVLVFADGDEDAACVRVQLAKPLVSPTGGHLRAVRPVLSPTAPYGLVTKAIEQAYEDLLETEHAKADAFVKALAAITPLGPSFSAYTPRVRSADVVRRASAEARMCDLAVLGRPEALDRSDLDTDLLLGALFGGAAPCLVMPRWITPHSWGTRALIAWKGTPEAARALRAAMPLLKRAEKVYLLVVDPRSEHEGEDKRSLDQLATYISRHGVQLEAPEVVGPGDVLHEADVAIASEVERIGADLLVMGAYGHPRLTELVFGGVSRKMINEARVPLLIAH